MKEVWTLIALLLGFQLMADRVFLNVFDPLCKHTTSEGLNDSGVKINGFGFSWRYFRT